MINYNEEQRKSIGRRLKEFRESLNLTQADLGRFFNMNQSSIAAIENGKSLPTLPVIMYLVENHGLSFYWLMTGNSDMYKKEEKPQIISGEISNDFGIYDQEVHEMYDYIEKSPMVREFLLEQFILFRFKNKKKIQDEIMSSYERETENRGE